MVTLFLSAGKTCWMTIVEGETLFNPMKTTSVIRMPLASASASSAGCVDSFRQIPCRTLSALELSLKFICIHSTLDEIRNTKALTQTKTRVGISPLNSSAILNDF